MAARGWNQCFLCIFRETFKKSGKTIALIWNNFVQTVFEWPSTKIVPSILISRKILLLGYKASFFLSFAYIFCLTEEHSGSVG